MKPTKIKEPEPVEVNRGNWRRTRSVASEQLVKLMKADFRTTAQIAETMRCSFVVARKRMAALSNEWKFAKKQVRQGERGPLATAYKIIGKRELTRREREAIGISRR